MNLTNFHSHCSYCDGKAPAEEFVKSAVAEGFISYGVSSHAPLPFDTQWTLKKERVPAYLQEIAELKEKYRNQIELYVGMEIDYLNDSENPANDYFQHLPLDYRIGSVHLIYAPDGSIIDTDTNPENFQKLLTDCFNGDLKRLVTGYFDASMRMVELGGFDFVGHCDKISYNASLCEQGFLESDWYKKKLMNYLMLIAEKGVMVEMNTKAFIGKGVFFPNKQNLSVLKDLDIPVLVNSDAHLPGLVNAGRRQALEVLKETGFRTVRQLMGGKWTDVEITL